MTAYVIWGCEIDLLVTKMQDLAVVTSSLVSIAYEATHVVTNLTLTTAVAHGPTTESQR